jgi:ribosomal protein S12 methylthiotransferase accessory factor
MSAALVGAGLLHDALAARLARDGGICASANDARVVVVAADTPAAMDELWAPPRTSRAGWLPVCGELDRVVVGPLVRPGTPGCPRCLDRRRAAAGPDPAAHAELTARHGARLAGTVSPLLTPGAAATAAAIAARQLAVPAEPADLQSVVMLALDTLDVARRRFLPDSECPACGRLPDDRAEHAVVVPRSRPKVAGSVRTRDLAAAEADLLATYVDPDAGLLPVVRPSGDFVTPLAISRLAGREGDEGYGRTLDFRSSRLTAMAEALERIGGGRPGGKRTVVRGTYRELKDQALDMTTVGLYPRERYETEALPFLPYHDDLELTWVWAYSFARREPVLVPERYAYYRTHHLNGPPADRPFVYEISNGCALGSCLEEAIIYALLEVAERDAFLMTWYARMSVPRLDPASSTDPRIPLLLERIAHRTGYRVLLFNTTLEQRIPCFWALALDESGDGDRPRALCAAGSALDPEHGAANALLELAPLIEHRMSSYPGQQARALAMVTDPAQVRTMEDHALLYSHPAAFDRLAFLLGPAEPRPFADFRDAWRWPGQDDLAADLAEMLGRYLDEGLDVVVVDQTGPEHRAGGFACVKAIVPGTLPMTFGHRARRVDGLPRLFDVAARLGYRDRRLTSADLNPHPHPFP